MTETPDGAKLCAWCGEPVRQSGVGRSRDYCRRSCRQRAYEARKAAAAQREAVVAAVAAAIARQDSSRDRRPVGRGSTRDEKIVPAPVPRRRFGSSRQPTTPAGRRPLLPPPPGVIRAQDQLPLDGE